MGLTARPSKNIDLTKIDDIQNEFFGDEFHEDVKNAKFSETDASTKKKRRLTSPPASETSGKTKISAKETRATKMVPMAEDLSKEASRNSKNKKNDLNETKETEPENLKIAELLATPKIEGVRHTSRPFTVPRSLTIDLNRLKSKFRARDLQYTQNELMDKMIKESLATVTAENFFGWREKAFEFVKSPEQCSRRSVTLTEESVSGMAELKADLALALNRRISADEIFTALLAIAFSSLYENGLL